MTKVLLINSISNVTVHSIRVVVTFIMTPPIVRGLGNHDYGTCEIVVAIFGYMLLLHIGIQPAITKYVAQYNALAEIAALWILSSTFWLNNYFAVFLSGTFLSLLYLIVIVFFAVSTEERIFVLEKK